MVDTLHGITNKLTIGSYDLYLKTAWKQGRIVHVDLTLSRGPRSACFDPDLERMEQDKYFLARSWMEDSCRMASKLMDKGVEIEEIVGMWLGVEGYPQGYCAETGGLVKGPLHAAAVLIRNNHSRWAKAFAGVTP